MEADKKARIQRIVGFICLGLAILNVALAVLQKVEENSLHSGNANIAVAGGLVAIGASCLRWSKRKSPSDPAMHQLPTTKEF